MWWTIEFYKKLSPEWRFNAWRPILEWNLRKLCFLSNLWCFGCFHSKRCVSVKKLHLFHINPPFSVSWGKMRFWVLFDEKTSLSSFSDEQHSFTRNWAQNEDLMLGGQFLCEIWGNYVSNHIYVFLDVSTARDVFLWRNYIFFILIHLWVFLEEKCVSEWYLDEKDIV